MRYRELVKNEEVSLLGFGCMRFPLKGDKIDREEAAKMLQYAIDNGVNYIDTAYTYHNGESELFVGEFLKQNNLRNKINLATKLPSWLIKTKEDMYKYLNHQLEKLETDYIDYYLVHTLNKDYWSTMVSNGLFEFLDDIKARGIVKHIGFSFHDDIDTFKKIVDGYNWEFTQIQYNYIDENYQAGREGLEYAYEKGLGVIIMEPLRGGHLVNNINYDLKSVIKESKVEKSPLELAFQFLYNKKEISLVLSGMSAMEQVQENIKVAHELGEVDSLNENEVETINKLCKYINEKTIVGCTNCKYCIPCPMDINIPECFSLLNNNAMFMETDRMKDSYSNLISKGNDASKCVECGQCEDACPQHIDIIEKLKLVEETLR